MIRQGLFIIIFSCFLLVGCRDEASSAVTPTPFPTETAVSVAAAAAVQPITLDELMADPTIFQNQQIEVTGRFHRLPRLICDNPASTYRSPASFTLRQGEVSLHGGGLGAGRDLIPDGLTMTINGRLLSWRGPVGCGKRAVVQEIWYIEASRVISPRPLTNATLTPAAVIADVSDPEQTLPVPTPTPTATSTSAEDPELPPLETPSSPPDLPETTPIPTATPTPTPDTDDGEEDREEGDEEDADEEDEEEEDPDPDPGEEGGPTGTPTATPTADSAIIEQGSVSSGDLVGGRLEAGESHRWRFEIRATDVLTVSAISGRGNLVLKLLDEEGILLLEQNEAPAQMVETIADFVLDQPGEYSLLVEAVDQTTVDYHLLFLLSDSYTFVMQGLIVVGQERSNVNLAPDNDHVWHFAGTAGTIIAVLILPEDNTMDPFIRMYDSEGENIMGPDGAPIFIDENGPGEPEELFYNLPETGMYAIQVGDYDFQGGVYTIVLTTGPDP
ncbi:MAG: hypothetical protein R6X32_04970 [Chloroflexota bacterium]